MRDLEQNPYSPEEQRIAEWFMSLGIGGGDDPVGALIAGQQSLAARLTEVVQNLDVIIAQLRHAYMHLVNDQARDLKQFAEGLIAPQIRQLEKIREG
jgi:hypothetical protein